MSEELFTHIDEKNGLLLRANRIFVADILNALFKIENLVGDFTTTKTIGADGIISMTQDADAIGHWCEYVHDAAGNLRTKYRIIVEPGVIFQDPDGVYRANTLREAMAYSLYNKETMAKYNLIWDQNATILNMVQWMRQAKNNQFLEYPLDTNGIPTGEELHSINGFTEADSFVDSITSAPKIRDTIFSERRSYGLHILSPFNFEHDPPEPAKTYLEVTKKAGGSIPAGTAFGFTVTYTAGTPANFKAMKNGVDCTSQVAATASGLKFSLKADETIRIDFEADESFRFEVTEDDSSQLTGITGSGGTVDMTAKKFVSSGGAARVIFTNGTAVSEKKPVYLKLKKIAVKDKTPLAGAEFSVYADSSCSGAPLAVMTTGSDGTASASVPGIVEDGKSVTLYVKETKAPAGCIPLTSPFTVTCKAPENSTSAGAVQVGPAAGIENGGIPTPEKALLFKRDALTNTGVGPATFKFSSATNGVYEFDTDESGELESIQWWDPTEESGKYIKPGEYAVTELVPPPGYEGTTEVQQIKLELDADGYPVPTGPLVFKNLAKVGLKIVKYDRQSHQPMSGVTFEIFKDGTSIGRQETDGSGTILLTGIDPGTYRAVEVDTGDDGHILDASCQEVELPAGGGTKELIFFNDSKPGLKLVKVDSADLSKTIAGAKFRIRAIDGSYGPQEFTTDAGGEIDLSKLPAGSYAVTELECPGYVVDEAQRIIHLHPNDTAQFVFTNTKKPGLRLIKTSADGSPLPGVTFRIARIEDGTHYLDSVTDGNGEINLSGLEPGIYSVVETAAPLDHILDKTEHHVELTAGKTAEIRLTNDKRPALRLIKTSSDGSNLAGVHFRIAKIEDGTHYLDRVTDQNGEINIEGLDPGVYSVVETATTEDHILDAKEHHVELFPNKTSTITIINQKRPSLVISKTDKDSGKPVPGVTFTLRGADGPTITTKPTGTDGKIAIENLLPGVYTITEQSVPENYILDTTPQTVTLFPNKEAQVEFQNYQRPTLKITKVDIEGKHLTGAIFEVKTKAGVKIGDFPVGEDGTITVPQKYLTEGYYLITEKQAPAGYILDKTPHEVYLRPGKTTEVSIENEKKPGLTIYKVDSVVGDGLKGAKFEIFVSKDKTEHGTYQKLDNSYYYTDVNGIIHLDNLDTGWYKIVEVEPPAGYMLKEPSEQIIYIEHDKAVEVVFENIPKSALVIRKIDAATGAPLANAWFRVRYLGGTSGSGGTIIGEYQTSANGNIIVTGLDAGTYIAEEISAPHGYVMDVAPQTAYISGKEQDCITLTFTNSKYGSLLIKKVDSVTKEPLSDVQFFVSTSDGSVVGNSNGYFTTDSAGTILVGDIKPGTTLVVKETRAIPGYILDDTPQTVKIESNETKTLEFRNQPTGSLLVRKVCATNPSVTLQNAEFKIVYADGTLIGDTNGIFRTDENGQIRITGLKPGKSVVVTEVKAPAGFLIDTAPQTAVIQSGKTVTLTHKNQPKGKLIIQKRDSQTGEVLPGAEFRITTAAGCEVGLDGVIGSSSLTSNGIFTTNAEGEIRITNLAPGAYILNEIKAPDGYVIDTPSTNVVIGQGGDTQTVVIKNTKKATLTIQKYVEGTTTPIPGVTFLVTSSDGKIIGSSNGEFVTDKNGRIVLDNLIPGTTVTIKETRTPDGYILDSAPKSIKIKAGEAQTLKVYNKKQGGIIIKKLDSVTRKPLEGVEFQLTYSDGRFVDDNFGHTSSKGLYRTDKNGEIRIFGITGTLVIQETETIPGYVLNTHSQSVKVNADDVQTITFYNTPLGGVELIKVDAADKSKRLSGAVFEIRKMDDALVDTVTTGKNGRVYADLDAGSYYALEIEAPKGYKLDKTPHYFKVKNGETTSLTITNKGLSGILIHKTDSATGKALQGVTFLLYDSKNTPIDQATTDNEGYAYFENLTYKILYKTNLSNGEYRTMYDNLSTAKSYELACGPAALGLASNEYVTEFLFEFGVVPAGFHQVEAPKVDCTVLPSLQGGSQFVNNADVGGAFGGRWLQAVTRWVTKVYGKTIIPTLPKTGY